MREILSHYTFRPPPPALKLSGPMTSPRKENRWSPGSFAKYPKTCVVKALRSVYELDLQRGVATLQGTDAL